MNKPPTDSTAKKKPSQSKVRVSSWKATLSGLPPGIRDCFKRREVLRAIKRSMDESAKLSSNRGSL